MTDPSMTSEKPNDVETAAFLRKFAGLMSSGQSATTLRHAAILIETLTVRLNAAKVERDLWQQKYLTVSSQVNMLEAECGALKHDMDGHVEIVSSTLAERDATRATVEVREKELAQLAACFDRERNNSLAKILSCENELAELRVNSDRERNELMAKLAAHEDQHAKLRLSLDRIRFIKSQTIDNHDSTDPSPFGESSFRGPPKETADGFEAKRSDCIAAFGEGKVLVPETSLHQARAQFEWFADEFKRLGEIASQVMCELASCTMDRTLVAAQIKTEQFPVDQVVRNILAA